jgi:alanine racemase
MVRLGIDYMAFQMIPRTKKYLENVGTLKSVISQIRTISAGKAWAMEENLWLKTTKVP